MSTWRSRIENYIGRELFTTKTLLVTYPEYRFCEEVEEAVHHIDGDRTNNDLSNLYVFRNNREHFNYHLKIKNWAIGLCGKNFKEKVEYLKTFPDLISNLDELKDLHERGLSLSHYMDD